MADGGAASSQDFDLRITSAADTLEYDDADLDTPYGGLAPTVNGVTLANGPPYYIRMSYYGTTPTANTEPYRLYASVARRSPRRSRSRSRTMRPRRPTPTP